MVPWQEIGDGCYRRRYERYDVNVGVVRGSDAVLVFDTRGSPVQGGELRDELRLLDRRAVQHVVNSHWHFDHVLGNQCLAGATRWAHPGLNEMFASRRGELLRDACRYDSTLAPELVDLELVLPDRMVALTADIDLGDRGVELRYFGRGHTDHDLVAHVPVARVCLAGDLLEESAPPSYGDDCFPLSWPNTLRRMLAVLPDDVVIVPGHGDVMSARDASEQTSNIEEVAQRIRAHELSGWPFPLSEHAVPRGLQELTQDANK